MWSLLLLEWCLVSGSVAYTELDQTNVSIIEWDIIEAEQDQEESDMMPITDSDR